MKRLLNASGLVLRRMSTMAVAELMPLRCVFCGVDATEGERYICDACVNDLPWIGHACPYCAMPVPALLPAGVACADCQVEPGPFVAAVAPLTYEFPVDAAIRAYKFHKRLHYEQALVEILCSVLPRLPPDIDAVLPVPLHRWRFIRRGFNQALELAVPVAALLHAPIIQNVIRSRPTPYQSGLQAAERRQNLRAAFKVIAPITARHVLIVDDVITTGETCKQVACCLLDAGADRVSVLAVARALRGPPA